jgi:glycosyltransferase involved in cell wall biosynthesis
VGHIAKSSFIKAEPREITNILSRRRDLGPQDRRAGLVTVVIPCYEQARFLGEAIESVLSQSYRAFEVIVVDDGSTDNTSEVASHYVGAYPMVRLIRQENRGASEARNRGLAEAKGEYVVFLDSDDRLLPGALEVGVRNLEERPECAFVSGRHRLIAENGSPLKQQPPRQPIIGNDLYYTLLSREYFVFGAALMYRRSIFDFVGRFDVSLRAHEDYDLYYRIARKFPIYHHAEVIFEYRRHDMNVTRNAELMLKETVTVHRAQRRYVKGSRRYEQAYKLGLREGQERYGTPLAEEVRACLQQGKLRRALRGISVLARYYPQGVTLAFSEHRMHQHKLTRRLRNRERKLRDSEQELRALESAPDQEEEAQALREQIQRLQLQIQNLTRQLQDSNST